MKNIKISALALGLAFANFSFAAIVKIANKSLLPLEVTIHYGSSGKTKALIIPGQGTKSFNSGTHALKSFVWNKSGEGIFHSLYAPSSRFMLKGDLEIYPEGYFIKNFTQKGVIKNGLVVYGNASNELGKTPLYNDSKKTMRSIAQDSIDRYLTALKKLRSHAHGLSTENNDFIEFTQAEETEEE